MMLDTKNEQKWPLISNVLPDMEVKGHFFLSLEVKRGVPLVRPVGLIVGTGAGAPMPSPLGKVDFSTSIYGRWKRRKRCYRSPNSPKVG